MNNFNEKEFRSVGLFEKEIAEIKEQNTYGNNLGYWINKQKASIRMQRLYKSVLVLFLIGFMALCPLLFSIISGDFSFKESLDIIFTAIFGGLIIICGILRLKGD